MKLKTFHLICTLLCLTITIFAHTAYSQRGYVDPSFQPVPSTDPGVTLKGQILQPDGKMIIWIGELVVSGVAKGQIARLHTDGTLDHSFSYCSCHLRAVTNVVLQPDGRLLVGGADLNGRAKVIRLNSDGSVDSSYTSQVPTSTNSTSYVWFVQSDGKSYVQLNETDLFPGSRRIYRLNLNGSLDTFTPILLGSTRTFVSDFLLHADRLYSAAVTVNISSSSSDIRRFHLDGAEDTGWTRPTVGGAGGSFFSNVNDIEFQSDGSMLLSGSFGTVNGFAKSNLARILPAGNLDLTFTAPAVSEGGFVKVVSNGKLLWNARAPNTFYRLNADGSLDPTFTDSLSNVPRDSKWVLDSIERIYYYGSDLKYHRVNPNGDVDQTFAPSVADFGKVSSVARQADGKVVIAGTFNKMNGVPRTSLVRVHADGALDPLFNAGSGFDQPPTQMVVQPDGKILAIGPFGIYNATPRVGIARINPDGSLDTSFTPAVSDVRAIAIQPDGKILIGGGFTSVNGATRAYFARLLADGNLDTSLTTVVGCCNVNDLLIEADGKIVIAGGFSGVDGFVRPNLARLTPSGALDQTLTATPASGSNLITKVAIQPSGKYLTAVANAEIRRRNIDGSLDNSFAPVVFAFEPRIDSIFVYADGSFVVGGLFERVQNVIRPNFARFSEHGAPDSAFIPKGANGRVRSIVGDVAGKIIIGGDFSRVNDTVRAGVARLSLISPTPFDFDGDGRADISVFRPSSNRWYELLSSNGVVHEETFGVSGDILAPADYDGDGATDEAIFRPSNAQWWYRSSLTGALVLHQFGASGDIPRPSDFDGDGKSDLVLFRPSTSTWVRFSSLAGNTPDAQFGITGDQPLVGDFDGDGKSDLAVFRPSTGDWWYAASSAGGSFRTVHWGQNGDIPVPADYDGDGKTDYAVFRPSEGGWYIYNSVDQSFTILAFGTPGDRPVAADYDGDGKADIAVFRPSSGIWYLYQTTAGFSGYRFGVSTDTALPGSLLP